MSSRLNDRHLKGHKSRDSDRSSSDRDRRRRHDSRNRDQKNGYREVSRDCRNKYDHHSKRYYDSPYVDQRQRSKSKSRKRSRSIEKLVTEDSNSTEDYIGEVLTEEQRKKVHKQMHARLQRLQKDQPKRLVPTVPSHATIFVNDGSFLETFKNMQQHYAEQEASSATKLHTEESLKLPLFGRRRGGKILKTGIVEKKLPTQQQETPKDAWALYLQEVKRYKNACCGGDSSRPLVK